jgi:Uma2 family endonuclease
MTASPQRLELLSLDQWCALGEDTSVRCELQEGVLIVSPKAMLRHQRAISRLLVQLSAQVSADLCVTTEPAVVIDPATPATVRIPDLVIERDRDTGMLSAGDVIVIVEILSPGTRRTDLVMKRHEYAEVAIPHHWIIDLDGGPSAEVLALVDGAYRGTVVSGVFRTTVPFDLRIDLDALVQH